MQLDSLWQFMQVDMEADGFESRMRQSANRQKLIKQRDFLKDQQANMKKLEGEIAVMQDRLAAVQDEAERLEMLDYAVNNDELKGKYILSDREIYKVSSSEIRRKIRDGEDVSSLLPDGVYEYIKEKGLYIV